MMPALLAPVAAPRPRVRHHVAAMTAKELRHLRRSPRDLALVLLAPGLLTLLFGYAFEVGEVKGVPVAVVDEDRTALSRRLVEAMERDDALRVRPAELSERDAVEALRSESAIAVVRLPAGLQAAARRGTATIPVEVSGVDPDTGPTAIRALSAAFAAEGIRIAATKLAVLGMDGADLRPALVPLQGDYRIHFNPRFLFIRYVMPGIVGLVLQLVTMGLLAGTLTREKELGTLEGILSQPVGATAVLLGKAIPYGAIAIVEVALVLAIARLGFDVSLGVGAVPALLVTAAFVMAVTSIAIAISSLARTQAQSLSWTIYYSLPAFLLSGAIAPTAVMPPAVRRIGMLFPLTFYCHAFRDVSLKGVPVAAAGADLGGILLHAAVALAVAWTAHRRWLP